MVFNDLVEDELNDLQTSIAQNKRVQNTKIMDEFNNIEFRINAIIEEPNDPEYFKDNILLMAESLFVIAEKSGFSLYKELRNNNTID